MSALPAPLPLTVLVPPINFSMIQNGLYRSGFPVDINFPFISRLRLHTILNLAAEEYSRDTISFLDRNSISYVRAAPWHAARASSHFVTRAPSYVHINLTGNRSAPLPIARAAIVARAWSLCPLA